MSTSKLIERICCAAAALALVISAAALFGAPVTGAKAVTMGYEELLFDTSRVHTIDIRIDDWDAFLSTAQSEEYSLCDVVIDGEAVCNVGIRGKGNTSLSTVASMDSDRYSLKLEFDQYDSGQSYHGLDKLSLNNLIQDNTMMKDYLTYQMMLQFGAAAPLSSYAYITVNGEDWGLYLAAEAVEESFLLRNYGTDYGELYKPDDLQMGGGRGNGKDFSFEELEGAAFALDTMGGNTEGGMPAMPEGFAPGQMDTVIPGNTDAQPPTMPEGFDPSQIGTVMPGQTGQQGGFDFSQMGGGAGGMGGGSEDTKLQYIDDDPASYSAIFDSAKTDITEADQTRLIQALKTLSGADAASAVEPDSVLRYFVVHNFVVNGDSYTGSMIHNYYLYEQDGRLAMIPWDYNLAFGTFQGSSADNAVNDDIDAPLSVTGSDRPMIDWIFANAEYTELYHDYFREFLETVDIDGIISQAQALIDPYMEQDPTKFCTYAQYQQGVQTLRSFCDLRRQSVSAQLAGQTGAVDATALRLSDMGTMNAGGRGGMQQTSEAPGTAAEQPAAGQSDRDRTQFSQELKDRMPQMSGTAPGAGSQEPLLLTGVSVLVLLAGLVFAIKFKR